jgi:hypothetical protein
MILDNLLLHPGLVPHLQLLNRGGQDGGWLHRLGRFRIGFESLVPLDVGDGEMALGELEVAAGLQLRVIMLLRLTCSTTGRSPRSVFLGVKLVKLSQQVGPPGKLFWVKLVKLSLF